MKQSNWDGLPKQVQELLLMHADIEAGKVTEKDKETLTGLFHSNHCSQVTCETCGSSGLSIVKEGEASLVFDSSGCDCYLHFRFD